MVAHVPCKLRGAVRSQAFARIPGGRHMECAYYFVDGTWNVPTTLTFADCVPQACDRILRTKF
jgi:hypothetical protein